LSLQLSPSIRPKSGLVALTLLEYWACKGIRHLCQRVFGQFMVRNGWRNLHFSALRLVLLGAGVSQAGVWAKDIAETEIVRIDVVPEKVRLTGSRDHRQMIVTGYDAAGNMRDLTHAAHLQSRAPEQILVDGATVTLAARAARAAPLLAARVPPPPPAIQQRPPLPAPKDTGEYNLASDFRSTVDSTSSWTYARLDGRRLTHFVKQLSGGGSDYPQGQPGWQLGEHEPLPLLALAVDPKQSGSAHDLPKSRVFGHAPVVICWTAPHAGSVAITGGIWMARDIDRRVTVSLETSRFESREPLFGGVTVPERDGDNDGREEGPNSSRPLSFSEAAHFTGQDPKRLTKVSLAEGDRMVLTVEGADFFGADLDIRYTTPVPKNAVKNEILASATPHPAAAETDLEHGTVVVSAGKLAKEVRVEWPKGGSGERVSFRHDVLPTLTRLGCNAGACHASPNGKGGFHLSLRGYDPVTDWEAIFYGENGRRVNLSSPASSLILRKPAMDVAHGGGHRLHQDSQEYHILHDWIAQGALPDGSDAPECVHLEVYPKERSLPEDARSQQLLALAHFSDGSVRDVTPLSVFTTSDEETAAADSNGRVTGLRRGQSAILVQYEAHAATAYLSWLEDIDDFVWSSPPERNYIDRLNFAQLREFQIQPSELCSDSVFIRRVYLDLLGRLPEIEETERFLSDTAADRRERLVDAVLLRPEFAQYWALKWSDVLRVRNQALTPSGVRALHEWLVSSARSNERFDAFARKLLTAEGGTFQNPAANYYRPLETPDDCAETTAELFLGIKIKCAKCHNHPFDRWTQEDYHGLAAFFSRVQREIVEPPKKEGSEGKPAGDAEMVVRAVSSGEAMNPRTGKAVQPWLPGVGEVEVSERDRRVKFADWLVQRGNPYFAKVAVNRIWYQLFGRGLVHPIDDFRDSNPAVNRPLLEALAADFAEHGFDQRQILRTILTSNTYQLSSQVNRWNENDWMFLSRTRPRRLDAEQLLDAICHVTQMPEQLGDLPMGTLATSTPSPDISNPFLQSFGQPERKSACACERKQEPDFAQALQMVNGDVVQQKLRGADNRFHRMLREGCSTDEVLHSIYLTGLCRRATDEELRIARAHITDGSDVGRGIEDICWVLLNTKEFLFRY
jgi:hypothetical protein